jgi:hypothetical protein
MLNSEPVKNYAKVSEANEKLVSEASDLASTSKIVAQKELDLMQSGGDPGKVEDADHSVEGKEKRLMGKLKQIFDGLGADEKLSSQFKLLKDRCIGLESRTENAKLAIGKIKDAKKKANLEGFLPGILDTIKQDFTESREMLEVELLKPKPDAGTFSMIQEEVKAKETQLISWEKDVEAPDAGETDEGSALKRFKVIAEKLKFSSHGNRHFLGPVDKRQDMAIKSGNGQYSFDHSAAVVLEEGVIRAAAAGAGSLIDRGASGFWIIASRPNVGFVGGTGEANKTVRVEVTSSGDVHSHPNE